LPVLVATGVHAVTPTTGGPLIVIPTLTWFVVDAAGSALTAAPFSIVLNLGFAALSAVPMVWPGRTAAGTVPHQAGGSAV